jgi:hypothetical protein
VDPRVRAEDALAFRADADRREAPHAAHTKSTHAIAEADPMRLEVRGRAPTGQSLADDPARACEPADSSRMNRQVS